VVVIAVDVGEDDAGDGLDGAGHGADLTRVPPLADVGDALEDLSNWSAYSSRRFLYTISPLGSNSVYGGELSNRMRM